MNAGILLYFICGAYWLRQGEIELKLTPGKKLLVVFVQFIQATFSPQCPQWCYEVYYQLAILKFQIAQVILLTLSKEQNQYVK